MSAVTCCDLLRRGRSKIVETNTMPGKSGEQSTLGERTISSAMFPRTVASWVNRFPRWFPQRIDFTASVQN